MAKAADKYRVTLDFSRESQQFLDDLQRAANCSTRAEVFKYSLNVFHFLVREVAGGAKLVLEGQDGEKREFILPVIVSKPPQSET